MMHSHLENTAHAALLWGGTGVGRRDMHGSCPGTVTSWTLFRSTGRTGHSVGMRKHNSRVIDGGLSPSRSPLGGLDRGRASDTRRELRNDRSSQGLFQPQDGEERGVVPVPVVEPADNGQVDIGIPGDGDETTPVSVNGSTQVGQEQIAPVGRVGSLVSSNIIVPGHSLSGVHGADLTGLPERKLAARLAGGHAAHSDPNNPLLQHVDPRWGSLPRYWPFANHSVKRHLVRDVTERVLMCHDTRSRSSVEVLDKLRESVGVYLDNVIATYDLTDPDEIIQTACTKSVFRSVLNALSPTLTGAARRERLIGPVLRSVIDGDEVVHNYFSQHGGNAFRTYQHAEPSEHLLRDAVAWARSFSTDYARTTVLVWVCLQAGTPLSNHHMMWVRADGIDATDPERASVTWTTPSASMTVPIFPQVARYLTDCKPVGEWWVIPQTKRTFKPIDDGGRLCHVIGQYSNTRTLPRPKATELKLLYSQLANTRKEGENHGC